MPLSRRFPFFVLISIIFVSVLSMQASPSTPIRVLYFTKSATFEHSVVRWDDSGTSHSERILSGLADAHGFVFTFSKDGSLFSPEYLEGFDVVAFYTTGDLFTEGLDGHPPMTPEGKQALLEAIAAGKGFVGIHSASDTFHTHECAGCPEEAGDRYRDFGEAADPYIRMVGGEFIRHGAQQSAVVEVTDRDFPGQEGLGERFELYEEWYSLKEFAPDLHTLMVLRTDGMEGVDYDRPDFPIAWARMHGKGRVWFNAMGHREDVWENPKFLEPLVGGILWAAGRVDAEVVPDLEAVAPGARVFPPPPSAEAD